MLDLPRRRDPEDLITSGMLVECDGLPPDSVHVHRDPHGGRMAILISPAEGLQRVYLIYRHDALPRRLSGARDLPEALRHLREIGVPDEHLAGARLRGPYASFDGAHRWISTPYRDGVALVGDAAGVSDPAWGCGLSRTLRDVRLLRDALLADDRWTAAALSYAFEHDDAFQRLRKGERLYAELFMATGEEADELRGAAWTGTRQTPEFDARALRPRDGARAPRGHSRRGGTRPTEPVSVKHGNAPGRTRTSDTRFRKPLLYPLSYEGAASDRSPPADPPGRARAGLAPAPRAPYDRRREHRGRLDPQPGRQRRPRLGRRARAGRRRDRAARRLPARRARGEPRRSCRTPTRILAALQQPLDDVRVLIVGQDPYPTPGHPVGLSFSVAPDVRPLPGEPAQHPPGVPRGSRPPAAGQRRPHALDAAGRAAPQPRPHRRAGQPRLAPRQGLGGRHRAGDPRARAAETSRSSRSSGAATRARSSRCSRRTRASRARIRARSRRTTGSSARGRSRAPTRCSPSRAPSRSTGCCPERSGARRGGVRRRAQQADGARRRARLLRPRALVRGRAAAAGLGGDARA